MTDGDRLGRFLEAQAARETYDRALSELRMGRKRTHWMWFVFPQLAGLGRSPTAQHFGIGDLKEAQAYLAHPILGERLRQVTEVIVGLGGSDPEDILGAVDAIKLRSSMTLFALADPGEPSFAQVLEQYFGGQPDALTRQLLGGG